MAEEPQKKELSNLLKVTCLLIGREREDRTPCSSSKFLLLRHTMVTVPDTKQILNKA